VGAGADGSLEPPRPDAPSKIRSTVLKFQGESFYGTLRDQLLNGAVFSASAWSGRSAGIEIAALQGEAPS
jgi:hypothetical protein